MGPARRSHPGRLTANADPADRLTGRGTSTGNAAGQRVDTGSSRRKPRPRISPAKGGYLKIHNIRLERAGCGDAAGRTAVHTGPAPSPPSARMIGSARCVELREVSPRPVRTDAALGLRAFPGPCGFTLGGSDVRRVHAATPLPAARPAPHHRIGHRQQLLRRGPQVVVAQPLAAPGGAGPAR